jgi:release factor glutamine methyltransferase
MAQAVQDAPTGSLRPDMTVGQARRALAERFRGAGLDSPELDARLLAGHALGLDQTGLAVEAARRLTGDELQWLTALAERRLAREPVARILGNKEFWGLALRISAATLVPRPETETVVEAALAAIDGGGPRMRIRRVADLGTGSGALLIALLSELPNAFGVGTDVSREAIEVARENALRHGVLTRARFIACDLGSALAGGFDLVVCNPPYVATGEIAALPPEVRRDPRRALDGGADGLNCYRAIAAQATRLLAPTGDLVVEIGVGQDRAVAELLQSSGLTPSPPRPDLAGIPRALHARVATMGPCG